MAVDTTAAAIQNATTAHLKRTTKRPSRSYRALTDIRRVVPLMASTQGTGRPARVAGALARAGRDHVQPHVIKDERRSRLLQHVVDEPPVQLGRESIQVPYQADRLHERRRVLELRRAWL